MQPVATIESVQTFQKLLPAPTAPASTSVPPVSAATARRPQRTLGKLREVLKVVLRTVNEIRRLLLDSAAEIGEIVGGDLGREVGRIAASCLLGLLSQTLLAEDAPAQPSSGLELNA